MKFFFPPQNQKYQWLQTNRSDDFGSLWSTKNLDFQTNLGMIRVAQKLVTNTTSTDDSDLGVPSAFTFWNSIWWAICDTTLFKSATAEPTSAFTEDAEYWGIALSSTRFDITNPAGTTYRYTYDGTGTDPNITAVTVPIGAVVAINGENFTAANNGTFTVTGSGANYFEVTNAAGVAENNKTIGAGYLRVTGGNQVHQFKFQESDLATFNERIWATTGGTNPFIYYNSGSGWNVMAALTANKVHKLLYFKTFDRLYYSNSTETINSVSAAFVIAVAGTDDYAIDLGTAAGEITTMVANSSFIWIGTLKAQDNSIDDGTYGSILAWDGFSAQVTNEYILPSAGVWAMTVINDIPYAIDTEGRVLKFTGTSFEEINRFPIERILLENSTVKPVSTTGRPVHFNGFVPTKNNTLLANVRNTLEEATPTHPESMPSGIWEIDLGTGNFTHRYGFSLKSLSSSTVTDYGQNYIYTPGAIAMNTFGKNSSAGRSTLLAGVKYFTDASSTKSAIFVDSPAKPTTDNEGQKRAYFVTTWFNSTEIQDKLVRIWTTFRRFLNSADKIIFKYRTTEEDPVEISLTWVSTTSFTTATNPAAFAPGVSPFSPTSGGEVEITQGTGAGACAHIVSVSGPSGGLYTITLDNAVAGVTGTAKARLQKWIKIFPEVTGQVNQFAQAPIGGSSGTGTRIEIKCVMEFTGDDEFGKLAIFSSEDIKITA